MKKLLFGLCSAACLSACAMSSSVPYQVNSTPPGAQIYVNSVSMGIAPIQIELACDKIWRCSAGGDSDCRWDHDDYVYEVTAYPPKDNPGQSQTERVNVCRLQGPSGYISFDFGRSRDQGVLSEQEYQQKVDKTLKAAAR